MSEVEPKAANPDEDFDPHRFTVEPQKKVDKKFASVATSLAIIGILVAGTIVFGKIQVASYVEKLTKAREDVAVDPAAPEKASPTDKITFPKFELSKEPDKKSPVAASDAIPVIDEPLSTTEMKNGRKKDVPEIGKNTGQTVGTEKVKPVISMMLESASAPVSKEVLSVAAKKGPSQTESFGSNPTTASLVISNPKFPVPSISIPNIPIPNIPSPTNLFPAVSNGNSAAAAGKARTVETMAAEVAEKAAISATAQSTSAEVGDRSRVILRGSFIECILESQLISNIPGISSCIVPANVYSDNGKRLLIKKGSKLVGEYAATVALGDSRFGVMWKRLKTPEGVVIDVDSAASDGLGAMGVEGVFDSHWAARLGTAFMFSIIADGISSRTTPRVTGTTDGTAGTTTNSTVQQSATVDTAQTFAKAQIAQAMKISPTFFKNRGDRVSVFVNRDLWFNNQE